MSQDEISRKRRTRCLLLGVAVFFILTVLVIVLTLTLKSAASSSDFKKIVIDRCQSYIKEHSEVRQNDCEKIWETFQQAYVGKDPCNVPKEAYDPLINLVKQDPVCSKMMFWSKTKSIVHAFTKNKGECYYTVEDTLLASLFDELTWCSKPESKETYTDCPGWSDCPNNTVRSFWIRTSSNFAATACGNVTAMLNGSLELPFNTDSVFGSVEVKNFDPNKMNSLTVFLIKKDTDLTTCYSSSLQNLQKTLNPNITYHCKEVPYAILQRCISDHEIPCSDCL